VYIRNLLRLAGRLPARRADLINVGSLSTLKYTPHPQAGRSRSSPWLDSRTRPNLELSQNETSGAASRPLDAGALSRRLP